MGEVYRLRLSHPPRWHYDILRALDYFREVGARRDERLRDAIALLEAKRRPVESRAPLPRQGLLRDGASRETVEVDHASGPARPALVERLTPQVESRESVVDAVAKVDLAQ
jgi:hypothetical protein